MTKVDELADAVQGLWLLLLLLLLTEAATVTDSCCQAAARSEADLVLAAGLSGTA